MNSRVEQALAADSPLIIGHRGSGAGAPENTLASFQLAIEAGADLVELDYRHSSDGVPVVIHDPVLDRTTDARQRWGRRRVRVSETPAAHLQTLDAGGWFEKKFSGAKIPLLSQALEFVGRRGSLTVIERKSGEATTLVELLRQKGFISQVVVISFDWKFLRELHELEPALVLGALGPPARLSNGRRPVHVRRSLGSRLADLARTGAKIAVWNRRLSKRAVRLARERGLSVWAYTINDAAVARRLIRAGVQGIITDDPGRLRDGWPRF